MRRDSGVGRKTDSTSRLSSRNRDKADENIWFESVAELAARMDIPTFVPEDVNHPIWVEKIRQLQPDILFSFYYRDIVKPEILDIPPEGCLNLHGSLLPK